MSFSIILKTNGFELSPAFPLKPNIKNCIDSVLFFTIHSLLNSLIFSYSNNSLQGHQILSYSHIAKYLEPCSPGHLWFYFLKHWTFSVSVTTHFPAFSHLNPSLLLFNNPFWVDLPLHGSYILTLTSFFPRPPSLLILHNVQNGLFSPHGFRHSINIDVSPTYISRSYFMCQKNMWNWFLVIHLSAI